MVKAGDINYYYCNICDSYFGTVHRDEGVTPMFLGCKAIPGCPGQARSMMYAKPPPGLSLPAPTWEWFKPSQGQQRKMSPEMRDHVRRGGLDLRALAQPARGEA